MFDIPILYIVFNRLDTVQRTFPVLQAVKPSKLFIAADGPRANREGEAEKCKQVKEYVTSNINWECTVQTLFREENLGCDKNVSSAITWFFNNVEMGIVLEDDCLADLTFFPFCRELLYKYKDEPKVMHIAGDNPVQYSKLPNHESYYFEPIQHCWGWASWARSWKHFTFELDDSYRIVLETNEYFKNKRTKEQWTNILNRLLSHEIEWWDCKRSLQILKLNGLCINPRNNLVQNIGMNSGVHFEGNDSKAEGRPAIPMEFPLVHPRKLKFNYTQIKKLQNLGKDDPKIIQYIKKILKKLGIFYKLKKLIKGHI